MTDLFKPCPFCGQTDVKSGGDDKFVGIQCMHCEAHGPNHYGKYRWEHRATDQNTRPTPSSDVPELIRHWTAPFSVTMDGIKDARGCWICSASNHKLAVQMVELMNFAARSASASPAQAEVTDEMVERQSITVATSLFGAFAHGVASKDVWDRRMNRKEADRWVDEATKGFEAELKKQTAALTATDAKPVVPAEPVASLQGRVQPWMMACFGPEISADKLERADRFIEEALELVQSVNYPRERIAALIEYVYGREPGDPFQEVGGVEITLAAFCLAYGMDKHEAGEVELARIWTKVEKIRAKQAAKPTGSALPVAAPPSPVEGEVERLSFDDLQTLIQVRDRRHSIIESSTDRLLQAFALSDRGLLALEQLPSGADLHITRKGRKAIDAALALEGKTDA